MLFDQREKSRVLSQKLMDETTQNALRIAIVVEATVGANDSRLRVGCRLCSQGVDDERTSCYRSAIRSYRNAVHPTHARTVFPAPA